MTTVKSQQLLRLFWILSLFIFYIGCFEYDEQIVINPDGSGNLMIHYQTERDMKFQTLYFPTDKYDIEYNINNNYTTAGIELRTHDILQKNDRTHVYMDFTFDRLTALNNAPRFQNEEFQVAQTEQSITLQRFIYLDESKIDRSRILFKSGFKAIFNREILAEIRFRFQWIVPGEIVDTNANLLGDHNRAIWIITLADILTNRSTRFYLVYHPSKEF